jgi:hypothetical protein
MALAIGYSYADIVTHFAQSAEIGVEQLPKDKGTDRVTFFAAMRAEKAAASEYNYLISFGEPECADGCAQSMGDFCGAPVVEDGWEHFEIEHYPESNDPGAVYMRTTIGLGEEVKCNNSGVTRTVDEQTGLVTFSGELVLSIWTTCGEGECPTFQRSDGYEFKLQYNASNREILGMSYNLAKFEYSAEATRNIRMESVGLLVEITTTAQSLDESNPPHFENAVLFSQTCEPEMELVTLTTCEPGGGNVCTQQLYLLPVVQEDSAFNAVKGMVEIHAQLISADGLFQSVAVLHVRMNIDSPTDYGTVQRVVDFLMATQSVDEPTMLSPYIIEGERTANLIGNQTVCVAVALPSPEEGVTLELAKLVVCSSATTDLSTSNGCRTENVADMRTYVIYERDGTTEKKQAERTEITRCFQTPKIGSAGHVLDINYATAIKPLPVAGGDGNDTVQLLIRRSLYNNDVVTTQNFWVDCPTGTHWDDDCACCVINNGSTDEISGWGIFLLVLLGLGLIAVVVCFCYWGTPGCSYGVEPEWLHPYYVPVLVPDPKHKGKYLHGFRDQYSGTVITDVIVDEHGARSPAHKHRHTGKKKPTKK